MRKIKTDTKIYDRAIVSNCSSKNLTIADTCLVNNLNVDTINVSNGIGRSVSTLEIVLQENLQNQTADESGFVEVSNATVNITSNGSYILAGQLGFAWNPYVSANADNFAESTLTLNMYNTTGGIKTLISQYVNNHIWLGNTDTTQIPLTIFQPTYVFNITNTLELLENDQLTFEIGFISSSGVSNITEMPSTVNSSSGYTGFVLLPYPSSLIQMTSILSDTTFSSPDVLPMIPFRISNELLLSQETFRDILCINANILNIDNLVTLNTNSFYPLEEAPVIVVTPVSETTFVADPSVQLYTITATEKGTYIFNGSMGFTFNLNLPATGGGSTYSLTLNASINSGTEFPLTEEYGFSFRAADATVSITGNMSLPFFYSVVLDIGDTFSITAEYNDVNDVTIGDATLNMVLQGSPQSFVCSTNLFSAAEETLTLADRSASVIRESPTLNVRI